MEGSISVGARMSMWSEDWSISRGEGHRKLLKFWMKSTDSDPEVSVENIALILSASVCL